MQGVGIRTRDAGALRKFNGSATARLAGNVAAGRMSNYDCD